MRNWNLPSNGVTLAVLVLGAATVSGCTTSNTLTSGYSAPGTANSVNLAVPGVDSSSITRDRKYNSTRQPSHYDYASIYRGMSDGDIAIPAFDYSKMNSRFLRQEVRYFGSERAGTIVVDAKRRHLYLVQPGDKAIRYGIAVGKEGYGWTGNSILQWKQKWPTWTPPAEMIERNPKLQKYADGLKGSPENPLGARAMYLYKNGKDTLFRIHGTTKPHSIGKAASSGCFRMINQDVIDLYSRVGNKVSVQVRPQIDQALIEHPGI